MKNNVYLVAVEKNSEKADTKITPTAKRELEKEAEKRGGTVSSVLRWIVENWLKTRK